MLLRCFLFQIHVLFGFKSVLFLRVFRELFLTLCLTENVHCDYMNHHYYRIPILLGKTQAFISNKTGWPALNPLTVCKNMLVLFWPEAFTQHFQKIHLDSKELTQNMNNYVKPFIQLELIIHKALSVFPLFFISFLMSVLIFLFLSFFFLTTDSLLFFLNFSLYVFVSLSVLVYLSFIFFCLSFFVFLVFVFFSQMISLSFYLSFIFVGINLLLTSYRAFFFNRHLVCRIFSSVVRLSFFFPLSVFLSFGHLLLFSLSFSLSVCLAFLFRLSLSLYLSFFHFCHLRKEASACIIKEYCFSSLVPCLKPPTTCGVDPDPTHRGGGESTSNRERKTGRTDSMYRT